MAAEDEILLELKTDISQARRDFQEITTQVENLEAVFVQLGRQLGAVQKGFTDLYGGTQGVLKSQKDLSEMMGAGGIFSKGERQIESLTSRYKELQAEIAALSRQYKELGQAQDMSGNYLAGLNQELAQAIENRNRALHERINRSVRTQLPVGAEGRLAEDAALAREREGRAAALSKADDAYFRRFSQAFKDAKGDIAAVASQLQLTEESANKMKESFIESGKVLKEFPKDLGVIAQGFNYIVDHIKRALGWIVAIEVVMRSWQALIKSINEASEFQTQTVLANAYQRIRQNSGQKSIPEDNNELLQEASELAIKYGENLNVVVENLSQWRKQIGDIKASQYIEQEVLRYHVVSKEPTEELFRISLGLSKQAAGAGFGLENIDQTFAKVYAAAAYAGKGFHTLSENEQEASEGSDILLEAISKDAAGLASFGLGQNKIIALNQALIQAFGNTGSSANEAAEKVGRLLGSLSGFSNGAKFLTALEKAGYNLNDTFNTSGKVIENIVTLMNKLPKKEQFELAHGIGGTRQYEIAQTLVKIMGEAHELEKVLGNQKNLNELYKTATELQETYAQKTAKLHAEFETLGLAVGNLLLPALQGIVSFMGNYVFPIFSTLIGLIATATGAIGNLASAVGLAATGHFKEAGQHLLEIPKTAQRELLDRQSKNARDVAAFNNTLGDVQKTGAVAEALRRASGVNEKVKNEPFVGQSTAGVPTDYEIESNNLKNLLDAKKDLLAEQNAEMSQSEAGMQLITTRISIYGISQDSVNQLASAYKSYNNDLARVMHTEQAEVDLLDKKTKAYREMASHFPAGSKERIHWDALARSTHTESLLTSTTMANQQIQQMNKQAEVERAQQQLRDQVAARVQKQLDLEQNLDQKSLSGATSIGQKAYLLFGGGTDTTFRTTASFGGESSSNIYGMHHDIYGAGGSLYQNAKERYYSELVKIAAQYGKEGIGNEKYLNAIDAATKAYKEYTAGLDNARAALKKEIEQKTRDYEQKTIDSGFRGAEALLSFSSKQPGAISYEIQYQRELLSLGKEQVDVQHEYNEEQKKINADMAPPETIARLEDALNNYRDSREAIIGMEEAMAAYNRQLEQVQASAIDRGLSAGIGGLFQNMGSDIANSFNGVNRINDIVGAYQMEINSLKQVNELENQSFNDTIYKTPYQEANMRLINDMYRQRIELLKQSQDAEKNQLNQENFIQRAFRDLSTTFFTQFTDKLKQSFVDAMTQGLMGSTGVQNPMQQMAQAGQTYYIPAANGMIAAANLMAQAAQINYQSATISMGGSGLNSSVIDTIGNGLGGGASTFAGLGTGSYIPGLGTIGGSSSGVQAIAATMAMGGGGGMGGLGGILGSLMGSLGGGSGIGTYLSAGMLGLGASGGGSGGIGGILKGVGGGFAGLLGAGAIQAMTTGGLGAVFGAGGGGLSSLMTLGSVSPYLIPAILLATALFSGGMFGPHPSPGKNPDQFASTNWDQMAANMVGSWYTSSQGSASIDPVLQQSLGGMNELQYLDQFIKNNPNGSGLSGAELQLWQQINSLTGGGTATGLAQANKNGGFGLTNSSGIIGNSVMNWNDLNTQVTNAVTNLQDYNNALQQGTTQALVGINVFGGYGMPYAYNTPGYNPPTSNYPYPGSIGGPGQYNPWYNPLNPGGASSPQTANNNGIPLPNSPTNASGTQTIIVQTPINIDGREVARAVQAYQLRTSAAGYNNVT